MWGSEEAFITELETNIHRLTGLSYLTVRLSPDVYSIGKWKHGDRQSPPLSSYSVIIWGYLDKTVELSIICLTSWERFDSNEKMTRFQFVKRGLISHFHPLPKHPVLISGVQSGYISQRRNSILLLLVWIIFVRKGLSRRKYSGCDFDECWWNYIKISGDKTDWWWQSYPSLLLMISNTDTLITNTLRTTQEVWLHFSSLRLRRRECV